MEKEVSGHEHHPGKGGDTVRGGKGRPIVIIMRLRDLDEIIRILYEYRELSKGIFWFTCEFIGDGEADFSESEIIYLPIPCNYDGDLEDRVILNSRNGIRLFVENIVLFCKSTSFAITYQLQIVYDQLTVKRNTIWNLLLVSGYLRAVGAAFAEETGRTYYGLTLTNKQVRIMFENMIQGGFLKITVITILLKRNFWMM